MGITFTIRCTIPALAKGIKVAILA